MADNTVLNVGTGGDTYGSDDIGGVKYQRIKLIIGVDGTNNGDVASSNPLPITGSISPVGVSNVVSIAAVGVSSMTGSIGVSSVSVHDVTVSAGALRVSSIVAIGVSSMPTTAVTQSGGWSIGVSSAPTTTVSSTNLGVNLTQITGIAPAMGNGSTSTTTLRVTISDDSSGLIAANLSTGAIRISSIVSIGVSSMPTTAVTQSGAWSIGVSSAPTTAVTQSGGWSVGVSSIAAVGVSSIVPVGVTSFVPMVGISSYTQVTTVRASSQASAASNMATFVSSASLRNYVLGYSVFNTASTATMIDFRDASSGPVLWSVPLPAGGGANLANAFPIFKTSANTALSYQVSTAVSTVYISVTGYQAA